MCASSELWLHFGRSQNGFVDSLHCLNVTTNWTNHGDSGGNDGDGQVQAGGSSQHHRGDRTHDISTLTALPLTVC